MNPKKEGPSATSRIDANLASGFAKVAASLELTNYQG